MVKYTKGGIYMKKKIPKILLVISFIPYAVPFMCGLWNTIDYLLIRNSLDFELFVTYAVIMFYVLVYYPVIPVCLAYQILYAEYFILKKKNISQKKSVMILIITYCCILSATILLMAYLH